MQGSLTLITAEDTLQSQGSPGQAAHWEKLFLPSQACQCCLCQQPGWAPLSPHCAGKQPPSLQPPAPAQHRALLLGGYYPGLTQGAAAAPQNTPAHSRVLLKLTHSPKPLASVEYKCWGLHTLTFRACNPEDQPVILTGNLQVSTPVLHVLLVTVS